MKPGTPTEHLGPKFPLSKMFTDRRERCSLGKNLGGIEVTDCRWVVEMGTRTKPDDFNGTEQETLEKNPKTVKEAQLLEKTFAKVCHLTQSMQNSR